MLLRDKKIFSTLLTINLSQNIINIIDQQNLNLNFKFQKKIFQNVSKIKS